MLRGTRCRLLLRSRHTHQAVYDLLVAFHPLIFGSGWCRSECFTCCLPCQRLASFVLSSLPFSIFQLFESDEFRQSVPERGCFTTRRTPLFFGGVANPPFCGSPLTGRNQSEEDFF